METILAYATPILTAVGFGCGWLIGKYTFVGLKSSIVGEVKTLQTEVSAIKSKLP